MTTGRLKRGMVRFVCAMLLPREQGANLRQKSCFRTQALWRIMGSPIYEGTRFQNFLKERNVQQAHAMHQQ